MSRGSLPSARHHRLHPPVLGPGDVERPRLTSAILATPDSGTCIVSAPPGYGATTAATHALAGRPGVVWISLDQYDSTPAHLVAQLSAASTGQSSSPDERPPDSDLDVFGLLAPFVDALRGSDVSWIVLDGFDSATHAPLLTAVSYLAANIPLGVRLAVTTHDAPRLIPVAASDRRLHVLDAEQLQATDDEAAQVVLATAPNLDVDTIEDITAAAQGWVAAIRAAAKHAREHPTDNAGHWLLTEGAGDLLGPCLEALSAERREFLEQTAFLARLSGPLCDAALQREGSQSLLVDLEAHGSLLVSAPRTGSDSSLRWWTRHPIVTAALQQRPLGGEDPDRDLRAARWFEAYGDIESTMRHLLAAGRLDLAADTLKGRENALFERGRAERLAEWYAALPPDSWGQMGWHLLRVGWGQAMSSDASAGAATLAQLRAHMATSSVDERDQRILGAEVATLAAYLGVLTGDTPTVITSARRAIDLFGGESEENSQQIAPLVLIRALLWDGDVDSARRELTRIRFQPFSTGVLRETSLSALRAQCLIDEGRVTRARPDVDQGIRWLHDHGLNPSEVRQFAVMTAQAALTLEAGDAMTAVSLLEGIVDSAMSQRNVGEGAHALIWLARARLCTGQPAAALADVQRARRTLHETAPASGMLPRIDLTEAFIRYVAGDTVRAERLLQRVPASEARTLMWARVTMHRQSSSLRRSLAVVDTDSPRTTVDKQLLLAMIAMKRSHALAEGHLLRAADLAEANGLCQAMLGCPKDLLVLARAVAQRSSHDHLARLVENVVGPEPGPLPEVSSGRTTATVAGPPLSAGELELITFLPRRDTNADIAEQLGISINTVKTRLYRLYRKLGVDSRAEAIAVARARGLIT